MGRVNPDLARDIEKLGAFDMKSCYNCGHCSALCPQAEGDLSFPRKMIRYSTLGLEDRILSSPEPWLCYYCGECSETCPRDANPGGLMMALRRFVIRGYPAGRIADLFYSAFSSIVAWIVLSGVIALAVVLFHEPDMNLGEVDFLSFVSLEKIHAAGVAVTAFIAIAFAVNITAMVKALGGGVPRDRRKLGELYKAAMSAAAEVALQKRFETCADRGRKRFAHMALSWGFAGMFLATIVVMGIDYEYLAISRVVPFVIGSVSGIPALYGTVFFMISRMRKTEESSRVSHQSDWVFLLLILVSIISGYVMVAFKYLSMPMAAYITFAVHLVAVFDMLISLPFTKFAHVFYRPVALWVAGLK
jgi:ferredoxin